MTTTSFIGDIKFKDGDTERLVSELATVDEVNTALKDCVSKQSHETAITNLNASIAQHVGGINSSVDSKLQGYYTKDECDDKYVAKTDDVDIDLSSYYTKTECDNRYVRTNGDSTIDGVITLTGGVNAFKPNLNSGAFLESFVGMNSRTSAFMGYLNASSPCGYFGALGVRRILMYASYTQIVSDLSVLGNTEITNSSTTSEQLLKVLQPNLVQLQHTEMVIGKSTNDYEFIRIGYLHGTNKCGYISSANTTMQLSFDTNGITFGSNSIFTKDVEVKGKLKTNGSQTITHYAPIEEDITNYTIGKPVFMSGKVYKRIEASARADLSATDKWVPSTSKDTEDCICSVLSSGTYKTYVGIITQIDEANKSITFATHGDYLFTVDDSSIYSIGDTVCYDGSVVLDNTISTVQIQSSIIGKVSSIVDGTHIAVFKY